MKFSLSLPLLTRHRRYLCLSLFHKIYNHNLLRSLLIPLPFYLSFCADHMHKVGISHGQTTTFFHSFQPHTSNEWNHLSADVASIQTMHFFDVHCYAYLIPDDPPWSGSSSLGAQLPLYLHLSIYFVRFVQHIPLCVDASLCDVQYLTPFISFSLWDVHIFCLVPFWCAHIWCY